MTQQIPSSSTSIPASRRAAWPPCRSAAVSLALLRYGFILGLGRIPSSRRLVSPRLSRSFYAAPNPRHGLLSIHFFPSELWSGDGLISHWKTRISSVMSSSVSRRCHPLSPVPYQSARCGAALSPIRISTAASGRTTRRPLSLVSSFPVKKTMERLNSCLRYIHPTASLLMLHLAGPGGCHNP